ncbi:MAG: tetratricopeptide repeat protein [Acidobacteria bacterium]|nr:tetratricopeptide repeat protein [Acidobacteriota bacterium]
MANKELTQMLNTLRRSLPRSLQLNKSAKEAMTMSDEQIYACAALACQLAEQGNMADANELLTGLSIIDPENAYIHSCLGSFYMRLDEKNLAAGEFLFALSLNPNDIAANTNLAELYFEVGELKKAEKYLKDAISLDPNEQNAFGNRARTLTELLKNLENK